MDEARQKSFERVTASGIVSESPCLVSSICGLGIASTTNLYTIYDGTGTGGKVKMRLVAVAYDSDFRLYVPPLFFANGIYVDFTTNGSEVTVHFQQKAR